MARTQGLPTNILFTYKGVEYTEALLTQKGVPAVEELLVEVGGERERIGLEVGRLERQLQEKRDLYRTTTEIRNKLKQFLVPGSGPVMRRE